MPYQQSENNNTVEFSRNNPYIALSTEDPDEGQVNLTNTHTIMSDGIVVNIPAELLNKAIEIEKYSCSVRFICFMDMIINLFYMIYGYIFSIIFASISLMGYYSTFYHKRSCLCCYLMYQYLQTFAKFFNLIIILSLGSGATYVNSRNETIKYFEESESYTLTVILLCFVFGCQVYITRFIHRYYYLLPTDEERKQLYRRPQSSL